MIIKLSTCSHDNQKENKMKKKKKTPQSPPTDSKVDLGSSNSCDD